MALSDHEKKLLAVLTQNRRFPDVTDVLRALASTGRIGDMIDAIDVVGDNCEINKNAKRAFLRGQLAGILTNNYFTLLEPAWYEAFVTYTVDHAGWAEPISNAGTGAALVEVVSRFEAAVRATM
jgi:hypothetical protein